MKSIFLKAILYAIIILVSSCKHQPQEVLQQNNNNTNPNPNPSNDTVCFNTQILPIIVSNCAMSGCHSSNNPADGVNLSNYGGIINEVKPRNANDSKLIKEITRTDSKRMPPPPANPLPADFIELLKKWINQGALNTVCNNPCDTSNVKFSTHVQPLIKNNCQGCHSNSLPSGGIALENYIEIKTIADNGKLNGSINHLPGYSAMPKGTAKMSNCNIRIIGKWIEAGAPNN
ncbi:MAG: c-type cytochrome domain-containing protein [Bacteroidia bacterium]